MVKENSNEVCYDSKDVEESGGGLLLLKGSLEILSMQ